MTQRTKDHSALGQRQRQVTPRDIATFPTLFILFSLFSLLAVVPLPRTLGRTLDLKRQSTQQPRDASSGADDEKDVRALTPGKPIRRGLAGGQQHSYQIKLDANQFLKVIVEQQGIDVEAHVSGPDGKQTLEFNSEIRSQGQEEVSLVAEAAGNYQLIVQPAQKGVAAGSYEIRIGEGRSATDTDRALHDARKQFGESLKLRRAGKYDEALPLAERALNIREEVLGPEHPDVAATLNELAILYISKSDYAAAQPLCQRALSIREKTLGPEHPDIAQSLNSLAIIHWERNDHKQAEPLYRRALAIREKALGLEHPDVAYPLHNLAVLYYSQGDYARAEPLYRRALAIWEKALGPEHPRVAHCLNNLANLYRDRGEEARAEMLFQRGLSIREKALDPEHPEVADSLTSFAHFYRDRGEYEKAEPMYRRGLAIREKALGPEHPDVTDSLYNLALLYTMRGEYAKAEPLYLRALAVREKVLGPEDRVAYTLNNLALLYTMRGEYAKAEPLYLRALAILEKMKGLEHPDVAISLNGLAKFYQAKGDLAQAIIFQSRANAASERNLARNLVIGSERQKLAYLATLSKQVDQTISLHLQHAPNDPAACNLAATMILQRKGRVLDATSQNLNTLRSRFNAEDQDLLDRLTGTRSQLARLVLGGPQNMTGEQYQARIKALEDQAEKDEAEISRRSSEFRAQSLPVTLEAVLGAIPPNAAVIEFASYRPFNAKATRGGEAYGPPHYVAYILRHEGEVQWKELGDAETIDAAIAALREALRDPKRSDVKRLARAVDAKVFQPVRPLIGDVTRLLISPDGSLNLIPFAALVDERGRYLVERYSISYLASGRDLLRLQVARESRSGPLVVAAPDFGSRRKVELARLEREKTDASSRNIKEQVKEESARSAFKEFYFPPLPYAAKEGEALRALLPGATLLTKGRAIKAALSQVQSPRLLHIATHGFFLKDQLLTTAGERGAEALTDDPERLLRQLERSGIRIESPLLRSGLALAGANEHKEDDNGILTALEVTGLNLWGTKLVVLSACDTGVGEVKNGDGVHGLRRALALAGSETQVMSLWAVSDKATRDLMVSYYRRLQEGEGRGEALRQVQLEMLKNVDRRHPYYWASFIQSGEWASLDGNRTEHELNRVP